MSQFIPNYVGGDFSVSYECDEMIERTFCFAKCVEQLKNLYNGYIVQRSSLHKYSD